MNKEQESVGPYREDTESGRMWNAQWRKERGMQMSATATSRTAPTKINLRFREPTTGTTPAVGDVDLNLQRRDAVIALVGGMPDDAYAGRLKNAVVTATNALETARGYVVSLIDDALKMHDALEGYVQTAAKEARRNVPQTGYGDPASYEATASAAEQKVVDGNWANVRSTTINATRGKANGYAQECVDGLTTLTREINVCASEYQLPAALRGSGAGSTPADQFKIEGAERHYRGQVLPMARACDDWNNLEANGSPEDTVRLFIASVRGLAVETRDMSLLKASERYPNRQQNADSERTLAWRLLAEFDKYEAQARPKSIDVALKCLALLRDTFRDLMGASHKFTSNAEFDAAILRTDSSQVDAAVPWKLASNWQARYLPGVSVTAYPGYSRIAGRSGMGVVYRAGAQKGG